MSGFKFDVAEVQKHLKTKWIGRKIVYQEVTATTMDDAEVGAKQQGLPHGTAFIADTQTKARGSKGRVWDAKEKDNLYLSFIIIKDKEIQRGTDGGRVEDIEVAASLATLYAVREIGVKSVSIKWFNDLWIRGHKLHGALTEYKGTITVDSTEKDLYVLGIGLNVNIDMFRHPAMCSLATSVLCQLGTRVSRERLFASIANNLETNLSLEREELVKMFLENQMFELGSEVKLYYLMSEKLPVVCKLLEVRGNWTLKMAGLNDAGDTWTVKVRQVSVRPHPTRSVYVYKGESSQSWSSVLLLKTASALVDTTQYEIKYLTDGQISKGIPADCALVIVGELVTNSNQSELIQVLQDFVKNGGNVFGTGSASQLFHPLPQNESEDNEQTRDLSTVLTSVINLEEMTPIIVISEINGSLNNVPSDCIQSVLATYESSGQPAVITCNYGDGRLCLCGFNIEVTYAELNEFFPDLMPKKDSLFSTVFVRDALIYKALDELGL